MKNAPTDTPNSLRSGETLELPVSSDSPVLICDKILEHQRKSYGTAEFRDAVLWLQSFPSLGTEPEILVDVVYNEVLLKLEADEKIESDDYLRRFPQIANNLKSQFQLLECLESDISGENSISSDSLESNLKSEIKHEGAILDERIELLDVIGRGGAATVY